MAEEAEATEEMYDEQHPDGLEVAADHEVAVEEAPADAGEPQVDPADGVATGSVEGAADAAAAEATLEQDEAAAQQDEAAPEQDEAPARGEAAPAPGQGAKGLAPQQPEEHQPPWPQQQRDGAAEAAEVGDLQQHLAGGALLQAYDEACSVADRKPNHLVRTCLQEATVAGRDTFHIEAPGNHKLVFTNRLADVDMRVFVQVFRAPMPWLSRLDLSYNQLTDVGAETLAAGLLSSRARRLSSLSLRSNTVGPRGCLAVCQALVNCHSLKRLDFSHNPLGRDGGLIIVDLAHNLPNLLELHIQDIEADIDVLVAIATMLLHNTHQLRVCSVENPRILTLQEEHTVHLGRMLRVNTYLSEIYLGKLMMRDEGVRQLVSFLLENKTLRVLDLRCNEIGADGAKHLGVLLASDCQLSRLNLVSNRIGEKCNVHGAQAIANALLNNRMLRHLDLNNNALCGGALEALADAVDQNATLETIGLFHNQWDQPSAYKFHQILNDRARILPLRADFVTSEVDLRIDVCKVHDFGSS